MFPATFGTVTVPSNDVSVPGAPGGEGTRQCAPCAEGTGQAPTTNMQADKSGPEQAPQIVGKEKSADKGFSKIEDASGTPFSSQGSTAGSGI